MLDILYTLFIFPIEQLIELSYIFVFRIFNNPALSIFGVSFVVSILTLPLYFMAEKHQRSERDIQKHMKPEVDNIKAVFSGDERFMRLATYYRQNGYHPLLSLRSSISLIIQIPFFIAAYHFLFNLEVIKSVSFGPIMDLAKPDSLITIKGVVVNILPIVMTIISCVSAEIYSKGFPAKDKIQLYGMTAIFLILLYNSPSGMVLYWTGNNLFSLIKNIIQRLKYPKLVTLALICEFCFLLVIYLLFIHKGWIIKRVFISVVLIFVPLLPFLTKFFIKIKQTVLNSEERMEHAKYVISALLFEFLLFLIIFLFFIYNGPIVKRFALILFFILVLFLYFFIPSLIKKNEIFTFQISPEDNKNTGVFILALSILFLLGGIVIPSSLIASSVQEFSFIESYKSPFPFLIKTAIQAFGIFFIWPLCIYFIVSKYVKRKMIKVAAVLVSVAIINVFIFPGNYGFLTLMFKFSENPVSNLTNSFLNMLIITIIAIIILFLIKYFKTIMTSILIISLFTFLLLSANNFIKIFNEFQSLQNQLGRNKIITDEHIYKFSRNGKNVLVIMLDRGISGYIPYIFDEKPELYNSFDGFVWYKNTISFGGNTNFGSPGIYGGYEYTPSEMQIRNDIPMVKKHNEALLMLPRIFLEHGFEITVTDPPYANYSWVPDLSIFEDYPQINATNINGMFTKQWLDRNQIEIANAAKMIESNLIRFSFFRFVPLFLRNFVYDNGNWLTSGRFTSIKENKFDEISTYNLDTYIALDILPDITMIDENQSNTYNVLYNDLTHQPFFLQVPNYFPSNIITDKGSGPFANEEHYHVNMAALLMLGKWFDFLKKNNVYNNTRIIIVSDHGWPFNIKFSDSIAIPRVNRDNHGTNLEAYAALLLVKDFNSNGALVINNSFMTNADVPLIALNGIVEDPINPWTGKILLSDKENGVTIVTSYAVETDKNITQNNIRSDAWLHVHTNIYDPVNWTQVRK
jgi:YidC/Oxa1 family membrane protein insertase